MALAEFELMFASGRPEVPADAKLLLNQAAVGLHGGCTRD